LKNLLALGLGCLLALGAGEAVLRFYNPFGFRIKGDNIVLPVGMRYEIENQGAYPGLDDRIIHLKNSLGFRGPEPPPDPERRLSILTVGGSTTECFYLSEGKTWPDVLASRLEASFPRLWLNNAGLDGHSSYGHTILVRDYLLGLKPKVIVFLVGINEIGLEKHRPFDESIKPRTGGLNFGSPVRLITSLAAYSEVVSLGLNLYRYHLASGHRLEPPREYGRRHAPHGPVPQNRLQAVQEKEAPFLEAYGERLSNLIRLCRRDGVRPVMVTQPTLNSDQVWITLEAYNEVTRRVCAQEEVPVVDAGRLMANRPEYFYDYVHFTNLGARVLGELIAAELEPYLAREFPEHLNPPGGGTRAGQGEKAAWPG